MRDSDIDALSADGAQEPYPADSAEVLLRDALKLAERAIEQAYPLPRDVWIDNDVLPRIRAALQAAAPSPAADDEAAVRDLLRNREAQRSYERAAAEQPPDRIEEARRDLWARIGGAAEEGSEE